MPELPDITLYVEALETRILEQRLEDVRIGGPFLLRTVTPPIHDTHGRTVTRIRRVGKRIAIGLDNGLWLVFHLMIAGRMHWSVKKTALAGRRVLAALDFPNGCLSLTEAGTQRRASLHVVASDLAPLDPGGVDVLTAGPEAFARSLTRENHTLKRALTDPRLFDGIGNAYSDEILFQARLSPVALTQKLRPQEIARLQQAACGTLLDWIGRLRKLYEGKFPEKVTAFREGMAVHGRYGQPCLECGSKIQRIRYAANETNYCVTCQTGGRLLADRSLSRLLREDWPRTLEEMGALAKPK